MNIFVIGATGRIADLLIQDLVESGHHVTAGARRLDDVYSHQNVNPVDFDLYELSVEEMAEKMTGSDAVYFAAGSRGKALIQVDAFGAIKTMQAAEQAGIKRYIMLSAVGADHPERFKEDPFVQIEDYYVAKHLADEWLRERTNLDYTVVQPSVLTEDEASGTIQIGDGVQPETSIGNVAKTLADTLSLPNTIGKTFDLSDGTQDIADALKQL